MLISNIICNSSETPLEEMCKNVHIDIICNTPYHKAHMSINRMDKLWYIHTIKYYTAMGMNINIHNINEFHQQNVEWMNSDFPQKIHMVIIPFTFISKKAK